MMSYGRYRWKTKPWLQLLKECVAEVICFSFVIGRLGETSLGLGGLVNTSVTFVGPVHWRLVTAFRAIGFF